MRSIGQKHSNGCSALDVANWFLAAMDRGAGDSITHLKLQKLVYYAQAWSLALRNKPLFDEDFVAWTHGPVVKSVWRRFKGYGLDAIPAGSTKCSFASDEE